MGLLRADEIREHCGVFAVVGHPKASELCYYGLYALQHRGQESAGMAVRNGSRIQTRKGMGLVSDVFQGRRNAARRFFSSCPREVFQHWR